MVKLGHTVAVCGIKAEITRPPTDKPDSGVIIANVQLPAMCAPEFKSGIFLFLFFTYFKRINLTQTLRV